MLVLSIILVVVALILFVYWFFAIRSYRKWDDVIGFVYGIPLTALSVAIYVIIISQFTSWRL